MKNFETHLTPVNYQKQTTLQVAEVEAVTLCILMILLKTERLNHI